MSRPKNHNIQLTFAFINPNSDRELCSLLHMVAVEKILTGASAQRNNTTLTH
jgi:hypothetical protein